MILPALLLVWHLGATAPAHDAAQPGPPACCFCRDTTRGGPLSGLARFEVWRQRQSPTWVTNRAVMLASPAAFRLLWPICAREAQLQRVAVFPTTPAEAGLPVQFTLSDSLTRGWWYYILAVDPAENRSCLSNGVWR